MLLYCWTFWNTLYIKLSYVSCRIYSEFVFSTERNAAQYISSTSKGTFDKCEKIRTKNLRRRSTSYDYSRTTSWICEMKSWAAQAFISFSLSCYGQRYLIVRVTFVQFRIIPCITLTSNSTECNFLTCEKWYDYDMKHIYRNIYIWISFFNDFYEILILIKYYIDII